MNNNNKIKYFRNKSTSRYNILSNFVNKKNFTKKIYLTEFLIHLFLLFLSFISIAKCKIIKVTICNYIISLPKSKGEMDFRGKYITDNLKFKKSINLIRSTDFINSIYCYIKTPNVIFYLSVQYFATLSFKFYSKLDFFNYYNRNLKTKKFIKKIFIYLRISKFISIDDSRVMTFFLEICEELQISSVGYMHYRFNSSYKPIKFYTFDTFFVWSEYFKKRLILLNNKYKNKKIIICGIKNKIFKKPKKKIDALFVWDLDSKLRSLKNLILLLKNNFQIAVKFKPSSQKGKKKLLIVLEKNNILYFKNENFLDIRNKYNISYFIGCSTTALYEACLYDALPIILENNSSIAKEIISEGIIKSAKNDYKNISKILKHLPHKKKLREQKKKIWGEIKYNKSLIINNIK